jgi:hypothetical protein
MDKLSTWSQKMVSYLPSDDLRKDSVGALQGIVKARMPTITKQVLRYELGIYDATILFDSFTHI